MKNWSMYGYGTTLLVRDGRLQEAADRLRRLTEQDTLPYPVGFGSFDVLPYVLAPTYTRAGDVEQQFLDLFRHLSHGEPDALRRVLTQLVEGFPSVSWFAFAQDWPP